jgi:hypothetical protein
VSASSNRFGANTHEEIQDDDIHDDITIERRVKPPLETYPTRRMAKIDERLLAIARGELEPEDPFGGLIPIYDDDDLATEVEDGWLVIESAPPSGPGVEEAAVLGRAVPRLRMSANRMLDLSLSVSAAFLATQIDGVRSIQELNEICEFDDLESLELIDELLRMGVIELF